MQRMDGHQKLRGIARLVSPTDLEWPSLHTEAVAEGEDGVQLLRRVARRCRTRQRRRRSPPSPLRTLGFRWACVKVGRVRQVHDVLKGSNQSLQRLLQRPQIGAQSACANANVATANGMRIEAGGERGSPSKREVATKVDECKYSAAPLGTQFY